ncbi:hypothetical protein KP509_31G072400 [Ceratopteris richardii]|uniref:Cytochrome c oxidase assembly factor 3 n=1 Tax=Ceratopteris richardii TaxID=49495 RepID=A0A8T2QZ14_CERRI|nr:hypothetical protein KP509_31G072400 [Ceratopteris richardii]
MTKSGSFSSQGQRFFSRLQLKNFSVAAGLVMFVGSVYLYTIKAVGGSDEMEMAIEEFEKERSAKEQGAAS